MRGCRDSVPNNRFSMNLGSVFHSVIDQMDMEDMLDTAHAIHNEVLASASKPPPLHPLPRRFLPPPFAPHLPTHPLPFTHVHAAHAVEYECDPHPPPMRSWTDSYDGYSVLKNASFGLEHSVLADQPLTVERPPAVTYYVDDNSDEADACEGQDMQSMTLPQDMGHHLTPPKKVEEPIVIMDEDASFPEEPPALEEICAPEEAVSNEEDSQPYVKKPPNAFMLYMKEQRANVAAELESCDNALVNTVLGKKWRSLSESEQAKYSDEAEILKKLHAEKYPWWSSRDNYGKKRKRIRRRKYPRSNECLSPPFIETSYSSSTSQTK